MDRTHGVRIRIAHSKTQRDGWGYETTVELSETLPELACQEHIEEIGKRLELLLIEAARRGERERDRREAGNQ